jgi:hypothetical protein
MMSLIRMNKTGQTKVEPPSELRSLTSEELQIVVGGDGSKGGGGGGGGSEGPKTAV